MRSKLRFHSREDNSILMNKTLKKGEILTDSPPHADLPSSILEAQSAQNLSADERSLIDNLTKLFSRHSSKPNRVLVRVDHTKHENGQFMNATGRLVRVEAIWIEGEGLLPGAKEVELDIQASARLQRDLSQSECEIRLEDSQQQLEQIFKIRPPTFTNLSQLMKPLGLSRQIAITYVPEQNCINQSGIRPYGQFSKFKQRGEVTLSNQSVESYVPEEFLSYEVPFVKLHDIQLLLTKDGIKEKRIKELLHANQMVHLAEKSVKGEMQALEGEMGRLKEQWQKERKGYLEEIEVLRVGSQKLKEEVQDRNRQLGKIRNLNDLYVKQNNELKAKVKEQIKLIQEMRRELSHIRDQQHKIEQKNETQPHPQQPPQPSIANIVINNTSPNLYQPQSMPKTMQAAPYADQPNISVNGQSRLKMCRSQETFRLQTHQDYIKGDAQKPIISAVCDPSSKSQKSYGIRKNLPPSLPPQSKNLVRVAKAGDISIHNIKDETRQPRQNKSISSFTSNLSGKSLSQRIGHITSPKQKDLKSGILVDYMLDCPPPPQSRPDLPRFHLARK